MGIKAHQDAIIDNSQKTPALIAHSGTAGTALTRRITSTSTAGALDVHIAGTSVEIGGGSNVNIVTGTQQRLGTVGTIENLVGGTIGSVLGIGGTVQVSGAGTNVNIVSGTQQTLGTVNVIETGSIVLNSGTVTTGSLTNVANLGTIAILTAGTVTSVGNVVGGTITRLGGGSIVQTAGTVTLLETGTVTAVNNLVKGTVTRLEGGSVVQTAGTLTTGTLQNLVSGTLNAGTITETRPSASTLTAIIGTNVNITLLAANTNRRGAYFYNEGTAACYVKLGTTATIGSFTVQMLGTSFYELPTPVYSGIIDGIWTANTGTMHITEIT